MIKKIFKRQLHMTYIVTAMLTGLVIGSPVSAEASARESAPISAEASQVSPGLEDMGSYDIEVVPLEREGVDLHLSCIKLTDTLPEKDILLVHGLTYSSHEFDINYKNYSLARKLAREGYGVWLLDIAGFGSSEEVEDGFMPDSDYAAKDIAAAAEKILSQTGHEKIDVLGWSWGTVTSSRFVEAHPEIINKYVMYAPIFCGLGQAEITEPFHRNTWEHAGEDFQHTEDGSFDYSVTDPVVIEMFCSSCWHYDGDSSPNGGRRDLCTPDTELLIDLTKISVPTLVICGDEDPYLNYELVNTSLESLPEGSELSMIEGGSHIVLLEEPFYHEFQEQVVDFLDK